MIPGVYEIIVILAIFVVPALLAGVIILLVKGGSAVRWFFGILFLLVVIGIFGLFSMRFARPARSIVGHEPSVYSQSHTDQTLEPLSQTATIQVLKDPVVWSEGMEEELTPAVYSSLETAAYGLGVQLQKTLQALPQRPQRIILNENDTQVNIALLEQCRRGLKFILPDVSVVIAEEVSSNEQIQISLQMTDVQGHEIQIPETQAGDTVKMAQIMQAGNQQGTLQAIIHTSDNKYVQQVRFDYRPWVVDSEHFRTQISHGKWAVIASDQTAVTKEQSAEQLTQAATDFLSEKIASASPLQAGVQPGDLQHYGFIVDEYYQQLQGLSGPIWRGALLLEVSPERLQLLQQDKTVVVKQVRRTWAWRIFSLLVMILLISVLYAVVNAITKGYYSVMSAVLAIGLVLIFVLFLFLV